MENKEVLAQEIDQKKKAQKGFTLIELLVVIAIIAILAAVAIPQFNKYRANAMLSNVQKLTKSIANQIADLGTSTAQNPDCSNATTFTIDFDSGTSTIQAKNDDTICDKVQISLPDWVESIDINAKLKLTANGAYITGEQDQQPPVIKVISKYEVGTGIKLGCKYNPDTGKLDDIDDNTKCSLK